MLLPLLITNLVKILMLRRPLPNKLPELLKRTTRPRPTLTLRNRPWCRIRNEPHILARPSVAISINRTTPIATHLLHADVAQERDQVGHAPGARPVDVVGGELLGGVGRGVEQAERGGDKGGHFAVRKGQEEALFVGPAATGGRVFVDVGEELGLGLQPGEAEVGG